MTGGGAAYRDPREGLAARRRELIEERGREMAALPARAKRVYAWRVARLATAISLLIGAALVVQAALRGEPGARDGAGVLTVLDLLRGTWIAAAIIGSLAWIVARFVTVAAVRQAFAITGDLGADVARLETTTAREALRELAMRTERASVGLWLASAAIHLPLVGTSLVTWVFTSNLPAPVVISHGVLASLGGAAALAVTAQRFARDLRRREVVAMLHADWHDGSSALGVAISAAAIWALGGSLIIRAFGGSITPFVAASVLWVILATLWVPGLFRHARRVVAAERQALGIEANVNWPRAV